MTRTLRLQATNSWVLIEAAAALPETLARELVFHDFPNWLLYSQCEDIWEWMDEEWSYTSPKGRLITRLEKAYLAVVGKTEDRHYFFEHMRYAVETLISQHRTPAIYYNITDSLKWERGTYGDPDSCMFNEYPYARAVLVKYGALALITRYANSDGNGGYRMGAGMGRCWIIPLESGNFYMRNYNGMTQQQMVEVMRTHLASINVACHGVVDRTVDLNCHVDSTQVYCYDNGNTVHFQTSEVLPRYEKQRLVVEPCYCCASAKHENYMPIRERNELPVCDLCPWKYPLPNGKFGFDFDPDEERYDDSDDDYDEHESPW